MDQIGKYIVLEEIGQGGMGVVYKARDPLIGREVAIKVVIEHVMRSPNLKGRFLREIASAGRLSHENIMTIYDAGDHEGRPYFVMELLSGTDLSAVIREGSLLLDDKLSIARQVARGLHYAHERGVVHRDIKPDNVRVLDSGRAKVMDFGIARVESATRTPTHSSIGTPRYMSPEQIKGEHVDRRTDIFSFGALLYELLTGTPSFSGERITTVIYKILHESPAPIDLGDVSGAEALCRVVDRCLKKNLDERYGSFDEVIADIDEVMALRQAFTPTVTAILPESVERAAEESPTPLAKQKRQPTLPTSDDTVLEPLVRPIAPRAAARPPQTSDPARASKGTARPARTLILGGIGLVVVLGLTYVIAQPGGESEPEPEEAVVAVDSAPPGMRPLPFEPGPTEDPLALDEGLDGTSSMDETVDEPADAPPMEASAGAALATSRRNAEASRSRMRTAKADADAAEAHPLYDRALAQERTADAALRRGTADGYAAAQTAYTESARLYDQALRTATEEASQQQEAEAVQRSMTEARASVVDRRTDARIANDFQRAETLRTNGERQLRDGAFEQAAASFSQARTIYAATAQTASRPVPTPAAEPPPASDSDPQPSEPPAEERAQAAAAQAAGSFATRLKQALEQENAGAMRGIHSTYAGWDGFFRIAENVQATVSVQSVEASGSTATADVSVRIRFRNTTKNADESTNVRYDWTLERRGDAWALASVATR